MGAASRLVVDTNVFVSAIILPLSVPRRAFDQALDHSVLLFSEATMSELTDVLFRQKLDSYVSREERLLFLRRLASAAEFVPVIQIVRECRDPKDDKFLEVALNGRADVIVTGDADLLELHPWRGSAILSPADYLQR
jgi:uncharacterized protein